jgi:hypothetical protein
VDRVEQAPAASAQALANRLREHDRVAA